MNRAEHIVLALAGALSVVAYFAALSPPIRLILFTVAMLAALLVLLHRWVW